MKPKIGKFSSTSFEQLSSPSGGIHIKAPAAHTPSLQSYHDVPKSRSMQRYSNRMHRARRDDIQIKAPYMSYRQLSGIGVPRTSIEEDEKFDKLPDDEPPTHVFAHQTREEGYGICIKALAPPPPKETYMSIYKIHQLQTNPINSTMNFKNESCEAYRYAAQLEHFKRRDMFEICSWHWELHNALDTEKGKGTTKGRELMFQQSGKRARVAEEMVEYYIIYRGSSN